MLSCKYIIYEYEKALLTLVLILITYEWKCEKHDATILIIFVWLYRFDSQLGCSSNKYFYILIHITFIRNKGTKWLRLRISDRYLYALNMHKRHMRYYFYAYTWYMCIRYHIFEYGRIFYTHTPTVQKRYAELWKKTMQPFKQVLLFKLRFKVL